MNGPWINCGIQPRYHHIDVSNRNHHWFLWRPGVVVLHVRLSDNLFIYLEYYCFSFLISQCGQPQCWILDGVGQYFKCLQWLWSCLSSFMLIFHFSWGRNINPFRSYSWGQRVFWVFLVSDPRGLRFHNLHLLSWLLGSFFWQ